MFTSNHNVFVGYPQSAWRVAVMCLVVPAGLAATCWEGTLNVFSSIRSVFEVTWSASGVHLQCVCGVPALCWKGTHSVFVSYPQRV